MCKWDRAVPRLIGRRRRVIGLLLVVVVSCRFARSTGCASRIVEIAVSTDRVLDLWLVCSRGQCRALSEPLAAVRLSSGVFKFKLKVSSFKFQVSKVSSVLQVSSKRSGYRSFG